MQNAALSQTPIQDLTRFPDPGSKKIVGTSFEKWKKFVGTSFENI